jgi:hypothetical protein
MRPFVFTGRITADRDIGADCYRAELARIRRRLICIYVAPVEVVSADAIDLRGRSMKVPRPDGSSVAGLKAVALVVLATTIYARSR